MKVALRRNKGILEFLGFVDGKGRIRKAKTRKVNPSVAQWYVGILEDLHPKLKKTRHPLQESWVRAIGPFPNKREAKKIYDAQLEKWHYEMDTWARK